MIPVHDKTLMLWRHTPRNSKFQHWVVVSGKLHTRDILSQGKQPRNPFSSKSGVNQGGSEWCEEKTYFSRLAAVEKRILGRPVRRAVTVPSGLSQFRR
jgi:hypothetical protein